KMTVQLKGEDSACVTCHRTVTPGIVKSWELSQHSDAGIECATCHTAKANDPSAFSHSGGVVITSVPSPKYCADCHLKAVEENSRTKHAWGAFLGNFKPYYTAAKKDGLDPLKQETAKKLDPEKMAKTAVSPLFPESSILKKIGLLDDPSFNHTNVTLGCIACHGSFVIADGQTLKGWPNTGVGRINPDGSLGSCTACHTRHAFSKAEARKPETCGQCHLGPDHPQMEIYEESKHGNIYAASGDGWNWDKPVNQWGPEDIQAPTCATCHMSGFGSVKSTHDVGSRLYWELQPAKSVPQWKSPDTGSDFVLKPEPDEAKAQENRMTMVAVCSECHSSNWVSGYFNEFDRTVSDYNKVWDYTDNLLKTAYTEGLISKDLPLDETPEIMHYLIWHHDGRRWRMGASMMGPDYTHWNGAVDAIMNKLGTLINDIEMRRRLLK
ncbi:MAG: multiheme c-type cytochrome, partial [Spirochaetota bacterium]